jgi:hypothetical protein
LLEREIAVVAALHVSAGEHQRGHIELPSEDLILMPRLLRPCGPTRPGLTGAPRVRA